MEDFRGRVVLVTGASSGIGAATAIGFARAGAAVAVHYHRNSDGADQTVAAVRGAGGHGFSLGVDLATPSGAEEVVTRTEQQLGAIDVLVNNAGDLGQRQELVDVTDDDYARIVDVNLGTAFRVSRQVLPGMLARRSGAIVNVSSVAARTGGGGKSVVYASAKAAVSTFTRGLAREVAGQGVRVNAVAPGVIATPFHDRHSTATRLEDIARANPMGRIGTPEECVGPIMFLASPFMSSYITGQVIEVNGGSLTP